MQVEMFHHIGKRSDQQDAFLISSDKKFFAVCDGLGGTEDGSVASSLAVEILERQYQNAEASLTSETFKMLVYDCILEINKIKEINTATTLVCLYIHQDKAYHCHVGDSKLFYISRNKEIWNVTKDHSVVQELFDAGVLETEEEMNAHPYRSKITKAISSKSIYELESLQITEIKELTSGDLFILCTDGVLENYTSSDFAAYFYNPYGNFKTKLDLIENQCRTDSKDNSTLIIVKI